MAQFITIIRWVVDTSGLELHLGWRLVPKKAFPGVLLPSVGRTIKVSVM